MIASTGHTGGREGDQCCRAVGGRKTGDGRGMEGIAIEGFGAGAIEIGIRQQCRQRPRFDAPVGCQAPPRVHWASGMT